MLELTVGNREYSPLPHLKGCQVITPQTPPPLMTHVSASTNVFFQMPVRQEPLYIIFTASTWRTCPRHRLRDRHLNTATYAITTWCKEKKNPSLSDCCYALDKQWEGDLGVSREMRLTRWEQPCTGRREAAGRVAAARSRTLSDGTVSSLLHDGSPGEIKKTAHY